MNKKPLFLTISLMLALSMMGVGYAYWTDTLTITGSITTGTLDGYWSVPGAPDFHWGSNQWKDVAEVTELYALPGSGPDLLDELYVTVANAYPGLEVWVHVGIHYIGSVPAHIRTPIVINDLPEVEVWYVPADTLAPDGSIIPGIPMEEVQLHSGNEYFFWLHIKIIEDDLADPIIDPMQGHTYTFTVELPLIQYNDPVQT